ncbi:MAG TPA: ATP-binding protein [Elusimicrobiota bacterium]|nr:ATP-binding protein [Elusimicrobiota bacterium]
MSSWEDIKNKIKSLEQTGTAENIPRSMDTLSVADYWQRRFEEEHQLLAKSLETKEHEMEFLRERVERQRTELQLTRAELESHRVQIFDKQRYWEERHRSLEIENQSLKEKITWEVQVRVLEEQNRFLTSHAGLKKKEEEADDSVSKSKLQESETARFQLAHELQDARSRLEALQTEMRRWEEERAQAASRVEMLQRDKTDLEDRIKGMESAGTSVREENARMVQALNEAVRKAERAQKLLDEREREYLLTMEDLARGFAHRVRNYLGIMSGTLQLSLSNEKVDEELKQQMLLVDQNAQEMLKSIEEFLSLARIPEMSLETLDVNQYMRQALSALEDKSGAANVKIHLTPAEKLPSVRGDTRLIGEAVSALVENAIEAMPDGGRLDVQTRWIPDDNMVGVSFKDSGKGIANHLIRKVFQAYLTTKKNHKGLGLSICKRVMELHRGKITLESAPGSGTLIELMFPVMETVAGTETEKL